MVNGQQLSVRERVVRAGGRLSDVTQRALRRGRSPPKAVKLRKGGTGVIILNEVDRQLLGISKRGGVL